MRRGIKYTAYVPKTIKAIKNTKSGTIKRIKYFLKNTSTKFKNVYKSFDKTTAKSIRTLSKKRKLI